MTLKRIVAYCKFPLIIKRWDSVINFPTSPILPSRWKRQYFVKDLAITLEGCLLLFTAYRCLSPDSACLEGFLILRGSYFPPAVQNTVTCQQHYYTFLRSGVYPEIFVRPIVLPSTSGQPHQSDLLFFLLTTVVLYYLREKHACSGVSSKVLTGPEIKPAALIYYSV